MKRVLSDGVEIAFEDTAHCEPALVLIHGAFGSRSHFAPLVAHLSECTQCANGASVIRSTLQSQSH
jgi:hypothetical protein